jgi:hypothetical protein
MLLVDTLLPRSSSCLTVPVQQQEEEEAAHDEISACTKTRATYILIVGATSYKHGVLNVEGGALFGPCFDAVYIRAD